MSEPDFPQERLRLVAAARDVCLAAVLTAFENAKIAGLCDEGAWEYAIGTLRQSDAAALAAEVEKRLAPGGDSLPPPTPDP